MVEVARQDGQAHVRRPEGDVDSQVELSGGLTKVLEAVPGGALVIDAKREIAWVNREALEFIGVTRERALGRQLTAVLDFFEEQGVHCSPEDHPISKLVRERRRNAAVTLGVRRPGQVGNLAWAMFRAVPLGEDARSGTIVTFTDVTALKQANQREVEFNKRIQDAQKLESLGALAGGIAHDFNNILAGILGNAAVVRLDSDPGSAVYEALRDIEEAARYAGTLCKQLLAYSGQGAFLVRPADLNQIVHETSALLSVSVSKKARITYACANNLPLVILDASQIRQVIMNIVVNASEALRNGAGSIDIRTRVVAHQEGPAAEQGGSDERANGVYVVFEVEDDGCGMDDETKARIFDPFFTTKATGRGLGMAAVSGIVRGHGGTISIDSQAGRGTTVRVSLPAHGAQLRPVPAVTVKPGFRGRGLVLVIDDEVGVRRVADRMLQRFGFSVHLAPDGLEGIAYFREHLDEVSVVLLDLTMPRLSGEETFRALREIRKDVPIILSSGYSSEGLDDHLTGGPTKFLQKPYDPDELAASLRSLLQSDDESG